VKLLENGIGIHHSGMIPILREIVELMISKKYIKLLFATESFAIGLDCPIKTAVFTGLKKFDGNEERYLLSHEYTQMAGRAGRRGIDTIGHVVHCNNLFPLPDQSTYKGMLGGSPQKLVSKFRISYPIILGYLGKSENPVSISTFVEFVEKSMIFEEVKKEIAQQMQIVVQTTDKVDAQQKQLTILQTPLDICRSYLDAETKLQTAVNKKRKELERQLQTYRNNNKYIVENAKMVREYDSVAELCKEEQFRLDNIKSYIYDQVKNVVSVLEKQGFIQRFESNSGTEESYILTKELGELATNIAEIHPLVFSQLLHQTNNLETISPKQLVGLLSCFTDIKVPQEYKVVSPNSQDATLQKIVEKCIQLFENIEDTECQNGMDTGIRYNNILNYDIIDDIMDWCNCETEQECKYFIQQTIGGKDISVGDFNKAILKIATITKELMSLAEKKNMVIFRYTLSQIEPMILKYVATSQSLYV
jgi:superfamily II RNA helicase